MMVEGDSKEVSEQDLLDALKFAQLEIKKIVDLQNQLKAEAGKTKWIVAEPTIDADLKKDVYSLAEAKFKEIVYSILAKEERSGKNKELSESVKLALAEKYPEQEKVIGEILHDLEKDLMRERILKEGIRLLNVIKSIINKKFKLWYKFNSYTMSQFGSYKSFFIFNLTKNKLSFFFFKN